MMTGCKKEQAGTSIQQGLQIDLEKLLLHINEFQTVVIKGTTETVLQQQFAKCRLSYKKVEWAIAYFVPATDRFINGPALDELEVEENKFLPPNGFQVMEELLFPKYTTASKPELVREIAILKANVQQVQQHLSVITISPDYVMDALRMEVYRIISLGITGFDSPVAFLSVNEAASGLDAIADVIPRLTMENQDGIAIKNKILQLIAKSKMYCKSNSDFNTFNRAVFIKDYLNPLSGLLHDFQKKNKIPNVDKSNVLYPEAKGYFEKNIFNVNAFIPSKEYVYTEEKAALGKELFYENAFSKNNNRSCASCHNPEKAFTDGLKTNMSLTGSNLARNTPTLAYASLQNAQFWDMRQIDLEKQSMDVIKNKDEMHGSLQTIIPVIRQNTKYKKLFDSAFPGTKAVQEWQIQNAIASYIRSLNAFDSRFDGYMRNENTLSEVELLGFNLFAGKAKCATCHFIPLFNGTVPPGFSKTEQEVIGTPTDKKGTAISSDPGRYSQYKMPQLLHAFKTPTLRNIAMTGPYMHNGVFTTLEEVVDFYNKGGGTGLGLTVDNQTLPSDQLNLTKKEQQALIAFMRALTDKNYTK
ncbi:MAG TPA: cytochrome c peroxidase [Flavobacterium sp.]|jgi:cytochrome c peroxidase